MAVDKSALLGLLEELKDADVSERMRKSAQWLYQELIEVEAAAVIGAGRYERGEERVTHRNGHRSKTVSTQAGDLELRIPKLRAGSFFPGLLEQRRRVDRALYAVVMEAYVHGVSTRKVDDLVKALGVSSGISKSEVSRICAELDCEVATFRDRSLGHAAFPYLFVDATYCKARVAGRVVSQAVVIAVGVSGDGRREVLGFDVGDSESREFWTAFFRALRARGLSGVQLVVSDAHEGLKAAIGQVFAGAAWQRCRVHTMRNILARVPKARAQMVGALVRTIFAAEDTAGVHAQFEEVLAALARVEPRAADLLAAAREDLLAFTGFPKAHWVKIWSTNPIERLNTEVKRRTKVVVVFPNPAALARLAGAVLIECHDEWEADERRYLSAESMAHLRHPDTPTQAIATTPPLITT